jgi:hypothetical protein
MASLLRKPRIVLHGKNQPGSATAIPSAGRPAGRQILPWAGGNSKRGPGLAQGGGGPIIVERLLLHFVRFHFAGSVTG